VIDREGVRAAPAGDCRDVNASGQRSGVPRPHRGDAKRFVARADEKLTAFIELESAVRNQQSVVFMRLFARRSLSNY
jgi:hypothetical protein